ncbi:MAG: mechanosensitive ion channel [Spirochaetia bacterium]|nr:mechanosensitive ion channel [Spirochaetia bacterium]
MTGDFFSEIIIVIIKWISGSFKEIIFMLSVSALIVLFVFGLRRLLLAFLLKKRSNHKNRLRWKRNSSYLSLLVIAILLFPVWMPSLSNFLAVIGIFGAGVLIVMKEAIMNIGGWFYITIRRPFDEGNRIYIDGYLGDVIEIRMQEFTMIEVRKRIYGEQSTGKILHIPNSYIFTHVLSNSSKEFSFNWQEMIIPLTLKSDWERAVSIIKTIAKKNLQIISEDDSRLKKSEFEYSIRYKRLEPNIFVEFNKGAVILILRFLSEPRDTRMITDQIWRDILKKLSLEKKIHLCENPDIWSGKD